MVSFDEGGPKGKPERLQLVCEIEAGGKLAIWGQQTPALSMRNIEAVLQAGMPCTVECEYGEPEEWAYKFGHTYWVAQDYKLLAFK